MIIGAIGGIVCTIAIPMLDKMKIDDVVGAISAHLVAGIWGTLAVGIFGDLAGGQQLIYQLTGVASVGVFCCISAFIIIFALKKTVGIRVPKEEEIDGLDLAEHGMDAYADFRMSEQ